MMNPNNDNEDGYEETFLERNRMVLCIVGIAVIVAAGALIHVTFSKIQPLPATRPVIVTARIPVVLPTPPPVATPTPQEVNKEEEMITQEHVDDREEKPAAPPVEADPVTTNTIGNGLDAFGLKAGNGSGSYFGGGVQVRSKFGWYAAQVQITIGDVLRKNAGTRNATFGAQVRIWSDPTGRVTRAQLISRNNNPSVDAAVIQSLVGVQLKEAPPAGMPMPIIMRIGLKRPN